MRKAVKSFLVAVTTHVFGSLIPSSVSGAAAGVTTLKSLLDRLPGHDVTTDEKYASLLRLAKKDIRKDFLKMIIRKTFDELLTEAVVDVSLPMPALEGVKYDTLMAKFQAADMANITSLNEAIGGVLVHLLTAAAIPGISQQIQAKASQGIPRDLLKMAIAEKYFLEIYLQYYGGNPMKTSIRHKVESLISRNSCDKVLLEKLHDGGIIPAGTGCGTPLESIKVSCPDDGTPVSATIDSSPRSSSATTPSMRTYMELMMNDCVLHKNAIQIDKDANRVPIIDELLHIMSTNPDSWRHSSENSTGIYATQLALREKEKFDMSGKALTVQSFKDKFFIKRRFLNDYAVIIESCTEVSLLFSSYGKGANRLGEDDESVSIPFHYYQGILNSCYYLVFFQIRDTGGIYPKKVEIYNMVATIVEQINRIPVVNRFLRNEYYIRILEHLLPQLHTKFLSAATANLPEVNPIRAELRNSFIEDTAKSVSVGDVALVELAGSLEFFITATASVGTDDGRPANIKYLPKVWRFVFEHGHAGLMAVFSACYIDVYMAVLTYPNLEIDTVAFNTYLQKSLKTLSDQNRIDDMLKKASCILKYWDKCSVLHTVVGTIRSALSISPFQEFLKTIENEAELLLVSET